MGKYKYRNSRLHKAMSLDFDYTFLLQVMKIKMSKMQKYFEKDGIAEHDDIVARDLRICCKLIDIIQEQDSLSHALDKERNKIWTLQYDGEDFMKTEEIEKGVYRFKEPKQLVVGYWDKPNPTSHIINIRNASRFFNTTEMKLLERYKQTDDSGYFMLHRELRKKKALNLFTTIFKYRVEYWWD